MRGAGFCYGNTAQFPPCDLSTGFTAAARPETAIPLYERVVALCRESGFRVETGEFGAEMLVESVNNGPVTILLDTREL